VDEFLQRLWQLRMFYYYYFITDLLSGADYSVIKRLVPQYCTNIVPG
jgi:hypothetical protein